MSNNINYGEIICNAVDEIVTAKLQGLSYDITKQCTIVNDSLRKQGKYTVSDGSVKFEACSEDTTLSKGNSVLVTIPNGDYNMQKMIVGRVAADSTEPFNYKSPLNNMAKFTSNILDQPGITYPKENTGLQANGKTAIIGPIYSISDASNFSGFTRLGISADFRSWLGEYNIIKGAYGLKLLVYVDGSVSPGVKNELVYELTFNSEDMIGNPYQFDTYFTQEKVFDISSLNNIKRIDVYFYQDGQFYDGNLLPIIYDNKIENEDIGLDNSLNEMNNLFVNNVSIYLGYESSMFEEETLMLYSSDPLTYHYLAYPPFTDVGAPKNLALRWIHKIDDNNFEILNGNNLDEKFEVHWFKYKPGTKVINQFAGPDWEELPWPQDLPTVLNKINIDDFNSTEEYQLEIDRVTETYTEQYAGDKFSYSFLPDATNQQELIKVVGYYKQGYGEGADISDIKDVNASSNIITYTSNILTFRNEEQVPDNLTYVASTQLTISFEDNSDGNYFIYNQNGKIINEGDGQGYNRRIQARFYGAPLVSSVEKTVDYIKWYLPYESDQGNTYTMLLNINENEEYEIENYRGIDYMVFTRYPNKKGEINNYQSYSIKNTWYQANNNNTVRCVVSINGVIYEAVEEMKFGKAGSQGTNITLVLDFMYGKNAIEFDPSKFTYKLIELKSENFIPNKYYYLLNDKYILAEKYDEHTSYFEKVMENFEIYVQAIMYDMAGKRIQDKYGTWNWSWYNGDNNLITIHNEDISVGEDGKEVKTSINSNIIKLSTNLMDIPKENYSILQVEYTQTSLATLYAYLPIPIKKVGYSHIEGAREVIYNHQGTPSYYTDAYVLYKLNKDTEKYDEVTADWNLHYDDELEMENGQISKMTESYMPTLSKITKEGKIYKALCASPFYASGYNNNICITCSNPEDSNDIYWSQPILIIQSKYDFAMLNEWDGKLKTDENKGTILSTMLGAGRKNKNNTFSGVLIGDVQDATDFVEGGSYVKIGQIDKTDFKIGKYYTYRNYAYYPAFIYDQDTEYYTLQNLTGVYGLHEGQISFSLKENGIATFGKSGKGQIIINGNESTIKSASFDTIGSGLKLDLDDGLFHIKNKNRNKVIIRPEEPYFQIFGESSQIPIINVGDSDYYLQSDKYALGGLGSKLDLVKGTFDIKGSGGTVTLSGDKDSPFFKVQDLSSNVLIHMDNKHYYLQSASYGGTQQLVLKDASNNRYLVYEDPNGKIVALDEETKENIYEVTEKTISQLSSNWNTIVNSDETEFIAAKATDILKIIAGIIHIDKDNFSVFGASEAEQLAFFNDCTDPKAENVFNLLKAISKEKLNAFNSMALKALKFKCLQKIIYHYFTDANLKIYTQMLWNENETIQYPEDTSSTVRFIVQNFSFNDKGEKYLIYQYNKSGKWEQLSSYTQMQLKAMFARGELEQFTANLSINEVNDSYLDLKAVSSWEFYLLFSILDNLDFSDASKKAEIKKRLKIIFKMYNFETSSDAFAFTDITIPKADYKQLFEGVKTENVETITYVEAGKITEAQFYEKNKIYFVKNGNTYNVAVDFVAGTKYWKQEKKNDTQWIEIPYPRYSVKSVDYLIPLIPNTGNAENVETYGIACKNIELANTINNIFTLGSKDTKDYSKENAQIATGSYDDMGNPITETVDIDHETGKIIYIGSLNPVLISAKPSGLKIDLNTGHIDGYDLYLKGFSSKDSDKYFVLNSADATTPFKIGDKLSATWNGELYCSGVKYIGNVESSGYTINIGNGLRVKSNGTGRFEGSCAEADYAEKAGTANYAYNSDKLDGNDSSYFATATALQDAKNTYNNHKHSVNSVSASVYTPSYTTTLVANRDIAAGESFSATIGSKTWSSLKDDGNSSAGYLYGVSVSLGAPTPQL